MKKQRKNDFDNEYNFWQSAADMMTGLVFILILVVALLGLYILHSYDGYGEIDIVKKEYDGNSSVKKYDAQTSEEIENDEHTEDDYTGDEDHTESGGSQSGGGQEEEKEEEEQKEWYITPSGGGYGEDDNLKAAIFVQLVDEETNRLISEQGVEFELYSLRGALQILNTYYPEKISYRTYETREDGTFYLPEKISKGNYYFQELTAVEGYDLAENQYFTIDRSYEWSEPYVVKIPISPLKNKIAVQMKDKESGESVAGATYQIVAKEDIVTLDGTVRYKKGEIVTEIVCDENGYGESEEIYLGKYVLKQTTVPEYYAGVSKSQSVEVKAKTEEEIETQELLAEKTQLTVKLADELYSECAIENASFRVTTENAEAESQILKTDKNGEFLLTDMEKNMDYHILEIETAENYHIDVQEYVISVDSNGKINGKAKETLEISNRMLRVSMSVTDVLFHENAADQTVELYDEEDCLIMSWITDEQKFEIEGLETGTYYILLNENSDNKYEFELNDVKDVQEWQIKIFTWKNGAVIGGMLMVAVFLIFVVIKIGRKIFMRKKQVENEQG